MSVSVVIPKPFSPRFVVFDPWNPYDRVSPGKCACVLQAGGVYFPAEWFPEIRNFEMRESFSLSWIEAAKKVLPMGGKIPIVTLSERAPLVSVVQLSPDLNHPGTWTILCLYPSFMIMYPTSADEGITRQAAVQFSRQFGFFLIH